MIMPERDYYILKVGTTLMSGGAAFVFSVASMIFADVDESRGADYYYRILKKHGF